MTDHPTPAAPSARAPAPPHLPHLPLPHHQSRLPPQVGKEELQRLRHALHTLPQVLRPSEFTEEGEEPAAGEGRLEALGCVMLAKATPALGRQSRWIHPQALPAALAQLKAAGHGEGARPLMLQRTAALEALGVARLGLQWTRLMRHTLPLAEPTWQVPVLYREPVDNAPVWDFYRTGDEAALRQALGTAPVYRHAAALTAHLNAIVEQARRRHPRQLASLLPRLQAECATPKALVSEASLQALQHASQRALERWAATVAELDTLEGLNQELSFNGYPATFPKARQLARRVTLFVGPPNSGKTHAAFERLAQAMDGAYLAPLRLLALEGRDRLVARGVPTSLLTGEERVPADGARVVSSTIEMVSTQTVVDVAVVDEGQMIFDPSRGWAWTQAIVGVPARELIIICSSYAVPAIQNLLGLCGESCGVREFERKQQVQLLPGTEPLHALQRGDAVVAFSRRDVLMLRDAIAADGHAVSVVYGALPPEVRRREAERFAGGDSDILVATDAIGMGLNLPIRRVLFSTLVKFDGVGDRALDESEVHQIAGRAGRFGLHEEGFVGVLEGAEPGAPRALRELLAKAPRAPRQFKAPVAPNAWHVQTIASRLNKTRLRDVLGVFVEQLRLDDAHFAVAELEQMLMLAEELDRHAGALPLQQRFVYAQAPVDLRADGAVQDFLGWTAQHASTGKAGRPTFLDQVDSHSRLERMEQALRGCTLWLWLDLRFPGVYGHVETVLALRSLLNEGIERQLKGKRPLAQRRLGRDRKPRSRG